MKTQIEAAREGHITEQMKVIAVEEGLAGDFIRQQVALGKVAIPYNPNHAPALVRGIGESLRVKVNVNLGTSPAFCEVGLEEQKLKLAQELEADAVMDLSIAGDLTENREALLRASLLPLGTVPVYDAFTMAKVKNGDYFSVTVREIFDTIELHAKQGVDFMTVHAGLSREGLKRLKSCSRVLGVTSRGGALTAGWMNHHNQENPLFQHFDELLDIAKSYDITLSLGDALRPGAISDASDRAQFEELILLGELAERANNRGVQVIVEGPGHIPLNEVEANVTLQKTLCKGAPFYLLGPVVCDIAPGYDHITAAIGGSLAALHGADFLCFVTPAEHLRLPTLQDVRQGIISARIAAFSADLARKRPYAVKRNSMMALARSQLDWEAMYKLALDGACAREFRTSGNNQKNEKSCGMCGSFCAIEVFRNQQSL